MTSSNYEIMRHFPTPEGLADTYTRQHTLLAAWTIVAAARAAMEEVIDRSNDLELNDEFMLNSMAEVLSSYSANLSEAIDK